jgi:N-acetylglucosaminyldiphosphoundecaprenol N-acetyl-beta-D-mannosaminyltransferase
MTSESYRLTAQRPWSMELLGLPVHRAGAREVSSMFDEVIAADEKAIVLHLNVHCVNLAIKHRWLHDFIRQAHCVYCDGDGVRLGLRILGHSPPPKVTYNVWLRQICALCQEKGYSIYFVGARDGVAAKAADNLESEFPRLRVAGTHHGYFDKEGEDNERVIAEINRAKPDILLVCFGMPVQERWIRDNWDRVDAHVLLPGGAALDYGADVIPVAPKWMVRLQLEWLFRFLFEPKRLFGRYILGNPLFVCRVLAERIGRAVGRRARPAQGRGDSRGAADGGG